MSQLCVQLMLAQALRKSQDKGKVRVMRNLQTSNLESVQRFPIPATPPIKHMQMEMVINSDNDRVSI